MKFATSEPNDGSLLELTGQMPTRPDLTSVYTGYFKKNPDYQPFAEQADRTVEVPVVANSIEMWQTFRDAYSRSAIFGKEDPQAAFRDAAQEIESLVSES